MPDIKPRSDLDKGWYYGNYVVVWLKLHLVVEIQGQILVVA